MIRAVVNFSEEEAAKQRRQNLTLLKGSGRAWAESDGRNLPHITDENGNRVEGHKNKRGTLLRPEKVMEPSKRCGWCIDCRGGREFEAGDIAPPGFHTAREDRKLSPDELCDANGMWSRC
jgi:hypothetical protein